MDYKYYLYRVVNRASRGSEVSLRAFYRKGRVSGDRALVKPPREKNGSYIEVIS